MLVVYAATRNYYHKLKPAVRSLLEHNDAEIIILAEDDNIPLDCPYTALNVAGQRFFRGPNVYTAYTYMSLMRLVLAVLLKAERVLYLDVDTIVLDDLTPVWETDMTGKWWAAVEERLGSWRPFGMPYYNSGVSLFSLEQMRADGITDIMLQLANERPLRFPDQDILNVLCVPDHIVPLDVRYNECFCTGETRNPAVVHYAGRPDYYENRMIYRREYLDRFL